MGLIIQVANLVYIDDVKIIASQVVVTLIQQLIPKVVSLLLSPY